MENKDLQELFAAKRTTEANRRRQAALRRKLEATAAPTKSRRLWPVWAGAAAASIALLIATLPLLITNSQPASIPIAQAEVPTAVVPAEGDEAPAPEKDKESSRTIKPTKSLAIKAAPANEMVTTAEDPIVQPEEDPIAEAPTIDLAEYAEPTTTEATPSPRIHRRTSTRMVNIPKEARREGFDMSWLADAFGSEDSTPLTLSTIKM